MNLSNTLAIGSAAVNFAPVPYAQGAVAIAQLIAQRCDEVAGQKSAAKRLSHKCASLCNVLNDRVKGLKSTEAKILADETCAVLDSVRAKVEKLAGSNLFVAFMKANSRRDKLLECISKVDIACNEFIMGSQLDIQKALQEHKELTALCNLESMEMLRNLAGNPVNRQYIQRQGSLQTQNFMQAADELLLVNALEEDDVTPSFDDSETRDRFTTMRTQRYQQLCKDVMSLHEFLNVPSTIPVLDGRVVKVDDRAISGDKRNEVFHGLLLPERKDVSLKTLRPYETETAKAVKRFQREIALWCTMDNEFVLPFYGILCNMRPYFYIVTEYAEGADVMMYLENHPEAPRLKLLYDGARGLQYLHSRNVVHGNVKCASILVRANRKACITDFGVARVQEEVAQSLPSMTTNGDASDWLAPEILNWHDNSPTLTKETDVYSFGMTIIELFAMKRPRWPARTSNMATVVCEKRENPRRPVVPGMTDALYSLVLDCASYEPSSRPTMDVVVHRLADILLNS